MKIREISTLEISEIIKKLCIEANYDLGQNMLKVFDHAYAKEESELGRMVINELIMNAAIAREEKIPLCQDCGTCVVFIDLGQDVHIVGGDLIEAVNSGVRSGYESGHLRKSICDPFTRINTGDNTPAILHLNIVPGSSVSITVAPKGGGSENMSRIKMMPPSAGISGIKDFVLASVKEAGGNPCPPVILGIGIGGNFERSAFLAKKALLRNPGEKNPDPELTILESDILNAVNDSGIGPMGYGGRITCLDVSIIKEPCHIASFPVALNINCHSARHKQAVI